MSPRIRGALLAVAASASGLGLAVAVGSAGADNLAATTTTLGGATGTPNQNICAASVNCTYVPFASAANPALQVPFDGTVTSFSVNSGSATGAVELRVLRPAPNGQYTGAGTSSPQNLAGGPQTFTVSMPVKAGDVLALDNSTSALLFDTSSANPVFTAYYQLPALADGSTAAPNNNKTGSRLMLSATVVSSGTPTTTTTDGTTVTTVVTNGTTTVTKTVPAKPIIGNPTQARTVWTPRVGTTFAFGLSTSAKVLFVFRQRVGSHRVIRGTLAMNGRPGTDRLRFKGRLAGGKQLGKGRYTVTITASNPTGTSKPVSLSFIVTG